MKNKLFFIIILSILLYVISCKSQYNNSSVFVLNDVAYRNIKLRFYNDGKLAYSNSTNYGLAFWGNCSWKQINPTKIVILNPELRDTLKYNFASTQFIPINADSACINRRYIFPSLYKDTVNFSRNYEYLILKGYFFIWDKKSSNFEKFINYK